jgi:hypothetical protein
MSRSLRFTSVFDDQFDCFGDYDRTSALCAKHCALRLRCAIEQEQNIKMELLSDLSLVDDLIGTIQ